MTKAKAIEVLNEAYDGFLIAEKVCSDAFKDEITDRKIALLTAIDALKQDNGWISVKDRLPDDKKQYLICGLHRRIDVAYYQPIADKFSNHLPFWQGSNCRFLFVTHWQPLPTPPEDVQPVKHGRWVFQNRNDEDDCYIYHCSECDFKVRVFSSNFISWKMNEKYCPGCGARMDGE